MKRNRAFRRFAAVFLALFCMAATSTVAFAGGGDGEPYYTGEETIEYLIVSARIGRALLHRGGDHGRL